MLNEAIILALQIDAVYVCFSESNIFHKVQVAGANFLDKAFGQETSKYIQKPLWLCPICMASFWTIILTIPWSEMTVIYIFKLILIVCGINYIVHKLFDSLEKNEAIA